MDKETLRQRRELLDLTQEQFAKELEVAPNTVSRWERGDRSIPSYLKLAIETVERKLSKKGKAK